LAAELIHCACCACLSLHRVRFIQVMIGLGALAYVLSLLNEKITERMDRTTKGAQAARAKAAEDRAAEDAAAAAARGELQQAAVVKSLSALPSWNERFLALQFEMEKLDEQAGALARSSQPLPASFVHAMHALNTTLASLTLTVNQRITESTPRSRRSSRFDKPTTARQRAGDSQQAALGITAATAFSDADEEDDELDLISYGIVGPVHHAFVTSATPGSLSHLSPAELSAQHGGKKVQRAALPRGLSSASASSASAVSASTSTSAILSTSSSSPPAVVAFQRPVVGLGFLHSAASFRHSPASASSSALEHHM
jgi:hypothetical protein